MNYPCHPNLVYLPDGASSQPAESTVFNEAVGAFVIECTNLNWPMICPASARFKKMRSVMDGEIKPVLKRRAFIMRLSGPL